MIKKRIAWRSEAKSKHSTFTDRHSPGIATGVLSFWHFSPHYVACAKALDRMRAFRRRAETKKGGLASVQIYALLHDPDNPYPSPSIDPTGRPLAAPVIKIFIDLFGTQNIESLLGDREFRDVPGSAFSNSSGSNFTYDFYPTKAALK